VDYWTGGGLSGGTYDPYQFPMASQSAANLAAEAPGFKPVIPSSAVSPEIQQKGANQQALMGMIPTGVDDVAPLAVGGAKALGIFAGPMAKTVNKQMLSKAEDMLKAGADKLDVWKETGWFKGADGKMRFEIDDSPSQFRGLNPEPQETPIRAALQHKELYDAYPDLIPAKVEEKTLGGRIQGQYYGYEPGDERIALSWSNKDPHSTLLHEIQHGIQAREGFSKGAGGQIGLRPNTPAWDIYQERLKAIREPMTEEAFYASEGGPGSAEFPYSEYLKQHRDSLKNQDFMRMLDRAAQDTAVEQAYRTSANEVESRNVQKRMGMSADERRATAPWLTQDVPDERQIISAVKAAQKRNRGQR
jgi:hypothetical protein